MNELLEIKDFTIKIKKSDGIVHVLNEINLQIKQGETVALVGESGSGKSMTALSIMNLLPTGAEFHSGSIIFKDRNLLNNTEKEMQSIRGKEIGLILQNSDSALNPVLKVGDQITEVIQHHLSMDKKSAKKQALQLLESVQLPNPDSLFKSYPHQLSGGQKQRILIAIAIACQPVLLIADEPTTSIDISIQNHILNLINSLKQRDNLSLLFITHDLSIIPGLADHIAVMYAGRIVEFRKTESLFKNPMHPYTQMLLNSLPKIIFQNSNNKTSTKTDSTKVFDPMQMPKGCPFQPRCPYSEQICKTTFPDRNNLNQKEYIHCYFPLTNME